MTDKPPYDLVQVIRDASAACKPVASREQRMAIAAGLLKAGHPPERVGEMAWEMLEAAGYVVVQ